MEWLGNTAEWFVNLLETLNLTSFKLKDAVDIVLVAVGIYYLLILIKGTRAMRIALGIVFLLLLSGLSESYKLNTVQWLLSEFFAYLVIAIIILFQSEIRRALAQFGKNPFKRVDYASDESQKVLEQIAIASQILSNKRIGGLIVLEREQGLRNYIEGGRRIDGEVTYDLLLSLFITSSPLHDGAVIIQDNRIAAASCFLPLTTNPRVSTSMGTRHRASIGITEETDAVVIVISEETGSIRVGQQGHLTRPLESKELLTTLIRILVDEKSIVGDPERASENADPKLAKLVEKTREIS
jgi:diadenylate cyclase